MFRRLAGSLLVIALSVLVTGCASSRSEGLASYYADKYQGRKTANGEIFDTAKLTAAHKTLPFGTRVRVTNLDNGRSVDVRINDRGPYVAGRVIDLSPAAARKLDMLRAGVVRVKLDILGTSPVASIND
jgi:rare lipoprotein A